MIGLSANTYIKMSDVYESTSFKGPTFDGEKESWAYYKVKMESYLARRDLAKFLTEREIPKDDLEFDPEVPAEKKQIDLRSGNRKASGILLDSIDTKTAKGKAAFHLIEKTHDASTGHAGGLFYTEWSALTKRYEKIECEKLEVYPHGKHVIRITRHCGD